ncbi:MFS transporter [Nocardia jejuensis]|uniref:MFS transporter n=1 Tax=Nocardia jejuensis TaxID=328049 RepID=UPI00082ECCC3|nr:MFS transporter [Nocardia jejuensis]
MRAFNSDTETPANSGPLRVLTTLCLTEITSWGILFYTLPVLALSITQDTHWPLSMITAAFSLGQLACAVAAIPVGRVLDRGGPRMVMTFGSILAVLALSTVALAPNLAIFFLGWTFSGVAMAAVLYPPAFAAVTRWWGEQRLKALMILTLAGGLASTVFAPLTALINEHTDWRTTYLILATGLALITIPAHWFGLRGPWPHPPTSPPAHAQFTNHATVTRSRAFAMLTLTLCLSGFTTSAAVFNLVPLLREQGMSPTVAALTLGLVGVGQVLGRIIYLPLAARSTAATRTLTVAVAVASATILLGLVTSTVLLIAGSLGAGLARGSFTLIQATAVTDRWGTTNYGRLNGQLTAPVVIIMALAPWAGTTLASWTGSYAHTYPLLGAIALLGIVTSTAASPPLTEITSPSSQIRDARTR